MSIFKRKFFKSYGFTLILLLSVILGSIIGLIFKEEAIVLKPFGDIFLNLLFTIVVPLVFITISSSIASMLDMRRLGKILGYGILIFMITGIIAAIITLITVKLIDPVGGTTIVMETGEKVVTNVGDQIVKALTVNNFNMLLDKSNLLPLIIFSIIFGIGASTLGKEVSMITRGLNALAKIMLKIVKYIMYYAPIGLCAYFAALIGDFGPQLLGSYARSMAIYYPLCIVYFFIIYALYTYLFGGKKGTKRYFKNIFAPTVTALSTQSSLATLPTTLDATSKMGVPKDIRDIVVPLGTTVHMEGSCMAAILKIAFLFGIFGKDFTGIDTLLIAILVALLTGIVMAGIPAGGLIGEMLIVTLYGFPLEAFPIIATIGLLVDPPATWINVAGDPVSSMGVTRMVEGKYWIEKEINT